MWHHARGWPLGCKRGCVRTKGGRQFWAPFRQTESDLHEPRHPEEQLNALCATVMVLSMAGAPGSSSSVSQAPGCGVRCLNRGCAWGPTASTGSAQSNRACHTLCDTSNNTPNPDLCAVLQVDTLQGQLDVPGLASQQQECSAVSARGMYRGRQAEALSSNSSMHV